jgi:hypothetical protein
VQKCVGMRRREHRWNEDKGKHWESCDAWDVKDMKTFHLIPFTNIWHIIVRSRTFSCSRVLTIQDISMISSSFGLLFLSVNTIVWLNLMCVVDPALFIFLITIDAESLTSRWKLNLEKISSAWKNFLIVQKWNRSESFWWDVSLDTRGTSSRIGSKSHSKVMSWQWDDLGRRIEINSGWNCDEILSKPKCDSLMSQLVIFFLENTRMMQFSTRIKIWFFRNVMEICSVCDRCHILRKYARNALSMS